MWIYTIIQLTCYLKTAAFTENGCVGTETRITCDRVPNQLPSTVQEIFLINIEEDKLLFD